MSTPRAKSGDETPGSPALANQPRVSLLCLPGIRERCSALAERRRGILEGGVGHITWEDRDNLPLLNLNRHHRLGIILARCAEFDRPIERRHVETLERVAHLLRVSASGVLQGKLIGDT